MIRQSRVRRCRIKWVGVHVRTSGGVQTAPLNVHRLGARAFGLFSKNQRQWQAKPLDDRNIAALKNNCARFGYAPEHILAHDSYLINPGHPDGEALARSRAALLDELRMKDNRLEDIPLILDTPDEAFWTEEIKLLCALQGC